jgi:hypothetical protein
MYSLAQFKRDLTIGSKWHCYNHWFNTDMGIRPVSIKQRNAVAFKTGSGNSWHHFEKASNYLFVITDGKLSAVTIKDDDGKPVVTYKPVFNEELAA